MTTMGLSVTSSFRFTRGGRGKKQLATGQSSPVTAEVVGRVPRISRLMALAIRLQGLITNGDVSDYAELARLGHVTRARMTQIMNLLNLAPDIQEAILFLPLTIQGHHPIKEWQVRPIAAECSWQKQRSAWGRLSSVGRAKVVNKKKE